MVGRRGVLLGAAGVTAAVVLDLVATHSSGTPGGSPPPKAPVPRPSDAVVAGVVTREKALLAAYATTVAQHPALADALEVPMAHHRTHLTALTGQAPAPAAAPTTAPTPLTEASAALLRTAVAALGAQERAAATAYAKAATTDVANGGLLASIAACEAVHESLLATAVAAIRATVTPTTAAPPTTHRVTTTHPPTTSSAPSPSRSTPAPAPTRTTPKPRPTATRSTPRPTPTKTKTTTKPPVTPTTPTPPVAP